MKICVIARLCLPALCVPVLCLPVLCFAQDGEGAAPTPREAHAAQCVAALDVSTQDLAQQVKAGKETLRAQLMDRLLAGAAFVGDAYVHGAHDEKQARDLANQALETQKTLPPDELAARQNACATEGNKLYASANFVQQSVVKRLAKRRMDRLLGA